MGLLSPRPTPVEVVVARVLAGQPPRIDIPELPDVMSRAGQPVLLKALYRVEDAPRLDETTRIVFSSEADGVAVEPAVVRRRDRPLLDDSQMGYLGQQHVLRPGTHVLRFVLRMDRDVQPWSEAGMEHLSLTAEGAIMVHVAAQD